MGTHNRAFGDPRELRPHLRCQFCDASRTAYAAGYNLHLLVQVELIRNYHLPAFCEEDGVAFLGRLVESMYLALAERIPARHTAYRDWLATQFSFRVQHRRKHQPETIQLLVLTGPCNSAHPKMCVVQGPNRAPVDDVPF